MRIGARSVSIIIMVLLTGTIPVYTQDRARSAGRSDYPQAVSVYHDYADAPFGNQLLVLMNFPLVHPFHIRDTKPERLLMFALAGGLRFERERTRRFVWSATLLDCDRSSAADASTIRVHFESLPSPDRSLPILPYYTFGLTLIDYNQSTTMELDARWFQGRIGGGIELLYGKYFSVASDIRAGAGLTSLLPGAINYSSLGLDSGETFNGAELRGSGSLRLRIGSVTDRSVLLAGEVELRRVLAERRIDMLTAGGSVRWRRHPDRHEFSLAVLHRILRIDDLSQGITSLHTGIHLDL